MPYYETDELFEHIVGNGMERDTFEAQIDNGNLQQVLEKASAHCLEYLYRIGATTPGGSKKIARPMKIRL